ncbi:hypothetical protein HZS61_003357 [Fusarium oxysporum f. sp. conglutinans]|uniref:Copia protein n=1 Tax=Fusarium oxysporum f. sp. conglutinans TaxID=100902 RepID=A0A8H6GHU3_FUSOX|nr:hypothetical protein HZS61_003357 [Fusarium oxysporum f. sp. conglutinans]KAG6989664.1 Copia protein [Fusarium oxysporum f. sp. conglutinans]
MTPIEQFSSTIDWRFDRYDIDRLGFLINRSISIDQLDRLIEIEIESINRIDQVDQSIDFQPWQDAADRVIQYLSYTRHRALRFGGPGGLTVASDASFADNTLDRKSSQAYTIRLFDGLIGWRASKQNTVTTSTTEAELLALAQAAKESLYVSRLLKELTVQMDDPTIRIDCDNTQTINLVTAEIATLKTKLRHVDIHNHWLRQEVQGGRIQVKYTKSTDMIADGLTKALPAGKWNRFLYQLGLEDIQERQQQSRKQERIEARL